MIIRRTIFILIIFILTGPINLGAEEISLTLDEAIVLTLRDNRDILLKSEELKKAKAKIKEARAALFPSLNFTGGWTYYREYYPKDMGQTTTQTTLKQYLYKGGEIINTIKYNGYNFEVAQAILDKTKLEVVLNAKKAFYTLLLANEAAELNRDIFKNSQDHLGVIEARYWSGQASESDLLKARESLASVEQAYTVSLNQVESAGELLRNLLYLTEDVKIKIDGQFAYEPKEVAYDEAFLKAMKERPEIRQYEAQEKSDKKAIEIAKSDNRPNIYVSWDYYSRSHTSLTFSPSKAWQDYNVITATFSWPIFDGWATQAKVEQAIVDLKETQITQDKTTKDIALELKQAYLDLKDALASIQSRQADVILYKDKFLVVQKQQERGVASALDLEDVFLGSKVSAFNQKQAIYDYLLAKARFDKATGGL